MSSRPASRRVIRARYAARARGDRAEQFSRSRSRRSTRQCGCGRYHGRSRAPGTYREPQQFLRPPVHIPERRLVQRGQKEPAARPALDQVLADQPVERLAHRRRARVEVFGEDGWIEAVARPEPTLHDRPFQRVVHTFGGRAGVHRRVHSCPLRQASASSRWSGRKASMAPNGVSRSWTNRTDGQRPSKFPRLGRCWR